jgi:hypothetical protein
MFPRLQLDEVVQYNQQQQRRRRQEEEEEEEEEEDEDEEEEEDDDDDDVTDLFISILTQSVLRKISEASNFKKWKS